MIALRDPECCALTSTDVRPPFFRRRAGRPQLKRDPLGGCTLRTLLLVPALLILPSASARAQAPIDERDLAVAGLSPGSDSNSVIARLGRPDSVTAEQDPIDADGSIHHWHYPGLVVTCYSPNEVSAFVLLTPARSTSRGLRVGESVAKVRRLYGSPTETEHDTASELWTFEQPSKPLYVVAVTIRAGKVEQVFVGTVRD